VLLVAPGLCAPLAGVQRDLVLVDQQPLGVELADVDPQRAGGLEVIARPDVGAVLARREEWPPTSFAQVVARLDAATGGEDLRGLLVRAGVVEPGAVLGDPLLDLFARERQGYLSSRERRRSFRTRPSVWQAGQ
jgi:hypothetical protein